MFVIKAPRHVWLVIILTGAGLFLTFAYYVFYGMDAQDSSITVKSDLQAKELRYADSDDIQLIPEPLAMTHVIIPQSENQSNTLSMVQGGGVLTEEKLNELQALFMSSLYPLFQYELSLSSQHKGRLQLFVSSMPEGLNKLELSTVLRMIETQLNHPEAEDLAMLIGGLYQADRAEAAFLSQQKVPKTAAEQEALLQNIQSIREAWLGKEIAELFYADEVAQDNPVSNLNSTKPSKGPLTEQEVRVARELASIENEWEQRYQRFLQEKEYIDQAGLSEEDKQLQIDELLNHHYAANEIEAARAYDRFKTSQQQMQE